MREVRLLVDGHARGSLPREAVTLVRLAHERLGEDAAPKVEPPAIGRRQLCVEHILDHSLVLREAVAVEEAPALRRVAVRVDVELERVAAMELAHEGVHRVAAWVLGVPRVAVAAVEVLAKGVRAVVAPVHAV